MMTVGVTKKLLTLAIVLAAINCVNAQGVGSPDNECRNAGFDYGIAKYELNDSGEYELSEGWQRAGYATTVTGNESEAYWTCIPPADGVLVKANSNTTLTPGGTSGTVYGISHGISHITLCGNEGSEAPEYPSAAVPLAVLAVAPALAYLTAGRR